MSKRSEKKKAPKRERERDSGRALLTKKTRRHKQSPVALRARALPACLNETSSLSLEKEKERFKKSEIQSKSHSSHRATHLDALRVRPDRFGRRIRRDDFLRGTDNRGGDSLFLYRLVSVSGERKGRAARGDGLASLHFFRYNFFVQSFEAESGTRVGKRETKRGKKEDACAQIYEKLLCGLSFPSIRVHLATDFCCISKFTREKKRE